MIRATLGLAHEPFHRSDAALLAQQQRIADTLHVHAQDGGFAVILGAPGVGKTVLREHIEQHANRQNAVAILNSPANR